MKVERFNNGQPVRTYYRRRLTGSGKATVRGVKQRARKENITKWLAKNSSD